MKIHLSLKTTFSEALPFVFRLVLLNTYLESIPKHITMAIINAILCFWAYPLWSDHMRLWMSDGSFTQGIFKYPLKLCSNSTALTNSLIFAHSVQGFHRFPMKTSTVLSTSLIFTHSAQGFPRFPMKTSTVLSTSLIFTHSAQGFHRFSMKTSTVLSTSLIFTHSAQGFHRFSMKTSTALGNSFIFTHSAQGFHRSPMHSSISVKLIACGMGLNQWTRFWICYSFVAVRSLKLEQLYTIS